jgi:hypothetical protein
MRPSIRTLLLVSAILLLAENSSALAGPQSLLDPYASIAPPNPAAQRAAKGKKKVANPGPQMERDISRDPMDRQPVVSRYQPPKPKDPEKAPKRETASTSDDSDGGFFDGMGEIKNGIVHSTKAATSGIVDGSKFVGGGMFSGTKKVGGGMVKGAKAVGTGFAAAGGKVADGAAAAGSKVADVPKALGSGIKGGAGKVKDGTGSAGEKAAALPKAVGHGMVATAGAVKDGTGAVGKKLVAAPVAMTRGIGRLFGKRSPAEDARATAQRPNGSTR